VQIRLEKINHIRRQRRFYEISVTQTLFGEWCLVRRWGPIGRAGGGSLTVYLATLPEAEAACERLKALKLRRGYAVIPVQLALF
jgi:predicted DNA-binding WGR domain protein